jgi:acetyl-CoA C-acetyltransferase
VRANTTAESLAEPSAGVRQGRQHHGRQRSQISDGAAAVIVASKAAVDRLGLEPLAEVVGYGKSPARSIAVVATLTRDRPRRRKAGKRVRDIDLFEINEAFAAVAVASMHDLGISADVCNVNGGAIALGHPIGMSGTRIALTLALELRRRGGGLGAAALCGGGGQGDALPAAQFALSLASRSKGRSGPRPARAQECHRSRGPLHNRRSSRQAQRRNQ